MSEIRACLYLGGLESATQEFCDKERITNVLSLETEAPVLPATIHHKFIQITDEEESILITHLTELTSWIITNIAQNESTLVHCRHGVSRSGSLVVAVLMRLDALHFHAALDKVQSIRPQTCPNPGFERQLKLWYSMQYDIKPRDPQYRLFQLKHGMESFVEPAAASVEDGVVAGFGYKCRKCRRALFYSADIVPHNSSWWQKFSPAAQPCKLGISVLPMSWMKGTESGSRLSCKHCGSKLGHFSTGYDTVECACGVRVEGPLVNSGKMDKFKVN